MSQNLSSAAVVIGALRVKTFHKSHRPLSICLPTKTTYIQLTFCIYQPVAQNFRFHLINPDNFCVSAVQTLAGLTDV